MEEHFRLKEQHAKISQMGKACIAFEELMEVSDDQNFMCEGNIVQDRFKR